MAPRTRRSAAVAAAALVAEIQMNSDPEGVEDDAEQQEVDEDDERDVEESAEDEVVSHRPPLKIYLKIPANSASVRSLGSATPEDAEMDYAAFKRTPKRRAKAKVIPDLDIESEDSPLEVESEEEQSGPDAPSHSTGTPSVSTKPMTTRQAVLASVVDSSHVSLNEGSRSKKRPLNENELALRREETARKRKNLSEKKLEDEKAETINRLLKKQSRKNKRTMDDRSPMPTASGARTPKTKSKNQEEEDAEGDEEEEDAVDVVEQPLEVKPFMYHWVSSLNTVIVDGESKVTMGITFSVPESVVPQPPPIKDVIPDDAEVEKQRRGRGPGVCAVPGCSKPRKYRWTKDWTIGACDSAHLRIIDGHDRQ